MTFEKEQIFAHTSFQSVPRKFTPVLRLNFLIDCDIFRYHIKFCTYSTFPWGGGGGVCGLSGKLFVYERVPRMWNPIPPNQTTKIVASVSDRLQN